MMILIRGISFMKVKVWVRSYVLECSLVSAQMQTIWERIGEVCFELPRLLT